MAKTVHNVRTAQAMEYAKATEPERVTENAIVIKDIQEKIVNRAMMASMKLLKTKLSYFAHSAT